MKVVKKTTAYIVLASVMCLSLALALWVTPNLMSFEQIHTIGNVYPDYTFNELVEASDCIERCALVKIEQSKYTTDASGRTSITTDYLFKSSEDDTYFVLRLNGGIVDNTVTYNADKTDLAMCLNTEYILFLNDLQCFDGPQHYTLDDEIIEVDNCFSLVTGAASIFVMSNNEELDDLTSYSGVYVVEASALEGACFEK